MNYRKHRELSTLSFGSNGYLTHRFWLDRITKIPSQNSYFPSENPNDLNLIHVHITQKPQIQHHHKCNIKYIKHTSKRTTRTTLQQQQQQCCCCNNNNDTTVSTTTHQAHEEQQQQHYITINKITRTIEQQQQQHQRNENNTSSTSRTTTTMLLLQEQQCHYGLDHNTSDKFKYPKMM